MKEEEETEAVKTNNKRQNSRGITNICEMAQNHERSDYKLMVDSMPLQLRP